VIQNRFRIAVVVSAIFGLVAAYGVYDFLRAQRRAVESLRDSTQDVVVAAVEVPAGTSLETKHLRLAKFPKASVPTGAFTSPAPLVGRIVTMKVVPGEPVLGEAPAEGQGAVLTTLLKPGNRALAVKTNEIIGVSGFLTPNDRVDVIANLERPDAKGVDKEITKLVLQDKRVLSVAQTVERSKDGKPKVASSITLEVTPEEAEKLAYATSRGQVVLALRASDDRETTVTKGSTARDFLPPPKPAPKSVRKPQYSVQVFNGDKHSVAKF
jgi:pilus assembly protein CpaB